MARAVDRDVPFGVLLSHATRMWSDNGVLGIVVLTRMWDWTLLEDPGSREAIVSDVGYFVTLGVALVGWSWTSGFVLGSLSRRTRHTLTALFCLLIVVSTLGSTTTTRLGHPRLFAITYYQIVVPLFLQLTLVALPALSGMSRAARRPSLSLLRALGAAVAIVSVTIWTAQDLEASLVFGRGTIPSNPGLDGFVGTADDPRPYRLLLFFVAVWPAAFMVVTAARERWRANTVS